MKKLLVALAAALTLTFGLPTPASAAMTIGTHWSNHEWAAAYAPNSVAVRAFFVLDRSGDATIHAALAQVLADLQYDLQARGAWGLVPAPVVIQEDQFVGQCDSTPWSAGNGYQAFVGYSFATLCSGGQGGGTSVTWKAGAHAAENYHPSMHIQREYSDYNTTYTHIYHELFHVLGIDGHGVSPSLMRPTLPAGQLIKPTGADYDVLTNFYVPHPMFS